MAIHPFHQFLRDGAARGGFATDDVLGALLPLLRQTLSVHEAGLVAPLEGVAHLSVREDGSWAFVPGQVRPPSRNSSAIDASQAAGFLGGERPPPDAASTRGPVGESENQGNETVLPAHLVGYRCWEHTLGHHDELTDIYSLGMLLASVACGLDFSIPEELARFADQRGNLLALQPRLHPVLASVIGQCTELNRHQRAPDLAQVIARLEHYRDQPVELQLNRLPGFQETGVVGRRRLIQSVLRDRLFEISRRNRLIHFRATAQMLNLTVASVPARLDWRNVQPGGLFCWQPELASQLAAGDPLPLGKYLRFEDSLYIEDALDRIISEARRDRAEFGFAQLRLVLCFLRWHNLKEAPEERIHSPLLLLPVELSRRKGVRDQYVLDPTTSEAEVNPALRHYLKELYNLQLPEVLDLKQTSPAQFHEALLGAIRTTEPGVLLRQVESVRLEQAQALARQRVEQFARKQRTSERRGSQSESEGDAVPSGEPAAVATSGREAGDNGADLAQEGRAQVLSAARVPLASAVAPAAAGAGENPYDWELDWCNWTLGNFHYRKMTLVEDYTKLIESGVESRAFDAVFSLAERPPVEAEPALALRDQHWVVACDAAQAAAIARARSGASYIIQGPPGTGKSQTITNLIADYVARGGRVLFVCEKRAAIDVVFHRLRQQGLDQLCCLIHDSQTDKKTFIQDLKLSYERLLAAESEDPEVDRRHAEIVQSLEEDLAALERFSRVMSVPHSRTGLAVRALIGRLVALGQQLPELSPTAAEALPDYPVWQEWGETLERLCLALVEVGCEPCWAALPFRWIKPTVWKEERPLERLLASLDEADDRVDQLESALELAGLPVELWDTWSEIRALLAFAAQARPLAERGLLGVLWDGPEAKAYAIQEAELRNAASERQAAQAAAAGWREALSPEDTDRALIQAGRLEQTFWRFLQPSFWRLRRLLEERYDFSRHTVRPAWSQVLELLQGRQKAERRWLEVRARLVAAWRTEDPESFCSQIAALRADPLCSHPTVRGFLARQAGVEQAPGLVLALADLEEGSGRLDKVLCSILNEHERLQLDALSELLGQLKAQGNALAELAPVLCELAEAPDALHGALRQVPVSLAQMEAAIGQGSVHRVFREDRLAGRFDGLELTRRVRRLQEKHRAWLELNARRIRHGVRERFHEHVRICGMTAAQLDEAQKALKKSYSAGRRELEHEFGKTMRFKSIRDLAGGPSGRVIEDLKPIWLMSPLSVSDTLPLAPGQFDVVIFDEASQVPVEEAIPAIYRAHQVIVVGDEMQLPPTSFFASQRNGEDALVVEENGDRVEVDLDSDSFLTQSAAHLPSTLLAWHYRSRAESLISFSNAAYYGGQLFTVPDRQRTAEARGELNVTSPEQAAANVEALLARSISLHFMEQGIYEHRRNTVEAAYIARLVQELLARGTGLSIGVVAFSEAQQAEIEEALETLAGEDEAFAARLETERFRETQDVFCGLFVKNLENVQGDERDIIIMSVCYGHDRRGRLLMNFGPINQRGGEKRLNVIFSRARHHMALVSSIRPDEITNDFNDGANSLKQFLRYAEMTSRGDAAQARRVLESLRLGGRRTLAPAGACDAVAVKLAEALRARGHEVDLQVGQSKFRCDLAIRAPDGRDYRLGILVDTEAHYANANLLDRYLLQPTILESFGWEVVVVLAKDWHAQPKEVLARLEKKLGSGGREDEWDSDAEGGVERAVSEPSPVVAKTAHGVDPVAEEDQEKKKPTPSAAVGGVSQVRRLEFRTAASQKFWEISCAGAACTVRFGRIGSAGQNQTKTFPDEPAAQREAAALVASKLKKGYVEVSV